MDLYDLTFEINWAISNPFSRKRYWKRLFLFFINPTKCLRATCVPRAGRCSGLPRIVVRKLEVTTLLNSQILKRVANLGANIPKIKVFDRLFSHIEGLKISLRS